MELPTYRILSKSYNLWSEYEFIREAVSGFGRVKNIRRYCKFYSGMGYLSYNRCYIINVVIQDKTMYNKMKLINHKLLLNLRTKTVQADKYVEDEVVWDYQGDVPLWVVDDTVEKDGN